MKNLLILIAFLSIFNSANSQTEKDNYKQVSTKFGSFFNASKNDSIVAMFSSEMNAALPIEKFTQVSTVLKVQLGAIQKNNFNFNPKWLPNHWHFNQLRLSNFI
jgi:hypothetical protein